MCGIFGIAIRQHSGFSERVLRKLVENFFIYSEKRGKESSGLVVKNHKLRQMAIVRKSCNGKRFIKSRDFKSICKQNLEDGYLAEGVSILGHTRIATNGMLTLDNQPIEKDGCVGVHNGIICNVEKLWEEHKELNRKQIIDTELLLGLIKQRIDIFNGHQLNQILDQTFREIEGTASLGLLFNNYDSLIIASNCGSLYYYQDESIFLFASEREILDSIANLLFTGTENLKSTIKQLIPTSYAIINEKTLAFDLLAESSVKPLSITTAGPVYSINDLSSELLKIPFINNQPESYIKSILQYNKDSIKKLKRCSLCILPETHPFISFDERGVCNYCNDYNKRKKVNLLGQEALLQKFKKIKQTKSQNCILMLSGGRDSCYALHVAKKELGLNPITFSYDWGMLTDLGRRNQARMCAKLKVENLIVSADIKKNRYHIRQNVEAFLRKPHLGIIGLFMAGDKAYHYFANDLRLKTGLDLINGASPLEWTYFKEGFADIKPSFLRKSRIGNLSIIKFFAIQAIKNPHLINESIISNLKAYKYYYTNPLRVINLFHYLPWDEKIVNETLINEYDWEVAPDTSTTWRIGDGTAAFYNYIYATVAGFTENDCFRSNQVLKGVISRDEALRLVMDENQPRYESLKWYCDTIGIDLVRAIKIINAIPKLYTVV